MQIKTDIRTISGEHNGLSFTLQGGVLSIAGRRYSKAEVKALVQIVNLLEVEGHTVAESLPLVKRKGLRSYGLPIEYPSDWEPEGENQ
jgi:hypothetical protein